MLCTPLQIRERLANCLCRGEAWLALNNVSVGFFFYPIIHYFVAFLPGYYGGTEMFFRIRRYFMSTPTEGFSSGADFIRQFLTTSPYVGHLGIQLTTMQPDVATLTLPFAEALVTIGTIVHGGAIASLIDTAAAVAAWSNAEVPANGRGTTVNLTVAYLAPAVKEDLQAVARVLRRGRNLVYLDVEVSSATGSAIAKGLVTYKLG